MLPLLQLVTPPLLPLAMLRPLQQATLQLLMLLPLPLATLRLQPKLLSNFIRTLPGSDS
jgi:hypothetical protein